MSGFGVGGYGLGRYGIGAGIPVLLSVAQPIFRDGATVTASFMGSVISVQVVFKKYTGYIYKNNVAVYPSVKASIDIAADYDASKGFYFKVVTSSATYYYGYDIVSTIESNAQNSPYSFSTSSTIPEDAFDPTNITNVWLYLKSESAVWTDFEMTLVLDIWQKTLTLPSEFAPDELAGYYFKLKDNKDRYIYLGASRAYLTENEARSDVFDYYILVNAVTGNFYANATVLQELQLILPISVTFTLDILNATLQSINYTSGGGGGGGGGGGWGSTEWYIRIIEIPPSPGGRPRYYTIVYNEQGQILYYIAGGQSYLTEEEAEENAVPELPSLDTIKTNDLINPTLNDRTPTISWIYRAPSDEPTSRQEYCQVQLSKFSDFRLINFDSERLKRSTHNYTFAELDKEGKFYIRVKVWDQLGNTSDWTYK